MPLNGKAVKHEYENIHVITFAIPPSSLQKKQEEVVASSCLILATPLILIQVSSGRCTPKLSKSVDFSQSCSKGRLMGEIASGSWRPLSRLLSRGVFGTRCIVSEPTSSEQFSVIGLLHHAKPPVFPSNL